MGHVIFTLDTQVCIVLICTCASAHPPILTVLCFFEVLRVTAHHAKFLHSESEGRSVKLTYLWLIWCTLGATTSSIKGSHTLVVALFAVFFLCSTKFAYSKQWLNAAETWQRDYELACFVAWYSFLHRRAGLNKAWTKWRCKMIQYPLADNFASM